MTESFADLFEQSLETLEFRPGSIVTGVVVRIENGTVLVRFNDTDTQISARDIINEQLGDDL